MLAHARLVDAAEALERKVGGTIYDVAPPGALAPVAVRGPERRVLALAQAAKAMFEGGSKVDTPPSLRVGQGLGRFAVLGSAGFEAPGVRGRLRAGRGVGCRRRAAGDARSEPQPRRCADDAVRGPHR